MHTYEINIFIGGKLISKQLHTVATKMDAVCRALLESQNWIRENENRLDMTNIKIEAKKLI